MEAADGTSTYDLAHADLGIRYLFTAPGRRWVPFIGGSFTGWPAEVAVVDQGQRINVDIGGSGLTAGGGINYFLSAPFALTSTVQWTFGRFTEASVEGINVPIDNFDGRSARFNLGFAWFPVR